MNMMETYNDQETCTCDRLSLKWKWFCISMRHENFFLPEVLRFFMFSRIRRNPPWKYRSSLFLKEGKWGSKALCGSDPAADDLDESILSTREVSFMILP